MRLSIIILTASVAYGAIGNLRVRGVTSTQAILEYTAPDTNPCSVEISESQTYLPLAHDVDPTVFAGSNLDNRPGSTVSGAHRVFVAGQRRAEKGISGKWYSRALQAFTAHHFRITCGGSQATGTFLTANIPLGNSYNEALPPDPAVSTRPYFSATGSYAWPEFPDWTTRSDSVIDPQTGMLLKRLALPQDRPIDYLPGTGDHDLTSVYDVDGAWTTPNSLLADDTAYASFTGAGSNMLFLSDMTFWSGWGTDLTKLNLPTEYLQLSAKAWCSGTCAGENSTIQVCLSVNGVTCWPTNAAAKYQEAALGSSSLPGTFVTLGTTVPILDSWTPAGFAPLTRADLSTRQGLVDVDVNGLVTWKKGGNPSTYFSPNWTAGSKITIAGSICTMTNRLGITQVNVIPASCSPVLSVPATGATYKGAAFGFLVKKKTASLDKIDIQYAKYITGTSQYIDFTSSGSARMCGDTLTLNSVTGGLGYHCHTIGDQPLMYWVDHITGDATYLGLLGQPLVGTTPTAPEHYYSAGCLVDGQDPCVSDTKIVSCTMTSNNQPGNLATSCVDVNPTGKGLGNLMMAFTAGDTPAVDATWANKCGMGWNQGSKVTVVCRRGNQDSLAWVGVFDPNLVGTTPGCIGSGLPGCIVAAESTYGNSPRWCSLHTLFESGNTNNIWIAGKYLYSGHDAIDEGPYTSLSLTSLSTTPAIAAGAGVCPSGSLGCDVVTVDGEPCNTTPFGGENTGSRVCPKNAAWAYIQDAKIGDLFAVEGEVVKLVAKTGSTWTLQRGYSPSGVLTHSTNTTMAATCSAYNYSIPNAQSNWSWTWDSAADPHATNSRGTTIKVAWDYDHPTPREAVTIGGAPYYASCGNCYAARTSGDMGDPPTSYVTYSPTFAGASGTAAYIERAQDHPSWLQDNASSYEKKWLLDGRPLQPLMDISDSAVAVAGQLYKVTSTTADGDNLSKIGNNIYVTRTSPTVLLIAGNCSAASPCPIWSDTTLDASITTPCKVTILSGSGAIFVDNSSVSGLGVTYTSGLSITTDTCSATVGTGHSGVYLERPMWSWNASSGVWGSNGTDERYGSSGYLGNVTRKIQPTWAYCGTQPLIDISSAATGDAIGTTSTDSYKYCVARKAGECRANSTAGEIYANCPNQTKRGDGSYGCAWYSVNNDAQQDMCFGNMSGYLHAVSQIGFAHGDLTGALGRTLTKAMGRYHLIDGYWHGKALSDASWMITRSMYLGGVWTTDLLGKLPPFPPTDTKVRWTFQPQPLKLTPPAGLGVDNAVVQFGYAENGGAGQFYCTSRQEKCLATASTVPAVPFQFPSEGAGGVETGVAGVPCAGGCTVAIPALSQRMLYYQIKYRDASNQTVATSQIEIIAVP